MRHQTYKSITFILALLLALSSGTALPGRAEAQMRCVGASPHSAPCARTVLPVAELTGAQVYNKLMMPCCRAMQASAMHCSMQHSVQPVAASGTAAHRSSLTARCVVTIHVLAAGASAPAVSRTRLFLTANPALAPPSAVQSAFAPALFLCPAFWTFASTLSPHVQPHLHGLRAPPAA